MRQNTTFYAFDDTEFETREECENYERHFLVVPKGVTFFDDSQIKNPYDSNHIEDWMNNVYYIAIENNNWDEVYEWFTFLSVNYYGYNPLEGIRKSEGSQVTVLHYIPDEWINMTDELNRMLQIHNEIVYGID